MVKYVGVLLLVMAFAAPAFAQDDVPQIEISLGYGNIGNLGLDTFVGTTGRHSGFSTHQAFNLNSKFAIENILGYYGFGNSPFGKTQMISETFGGKVNYRTSGPVLYASGGLGAGWLRFPDLGAGTNSAFAVRFGGGVDVPLNDYLAIKVDVSRHSYHFDGWKSGTNFSTGLVLKISQ